MKKRLVITFLMSVIITLCSIVCANAQNGGQYFQSGSLKVQYTGYSSGHYVVTITNLEACAYSVDGKWLSSDTTIALGASQSKVINLPGTFTGGAGIKFKPDGNACASDKGWVEISAPLTLPVTFYDIKVTLSHTINKQ
jgi:hypothetical protein